MKNLLLTLVMALCIPIMGSCSKSEDPGIPTPWLTVEVPYGLLSISSAKQTKSVGVKTSVAPEEWKVKITDGDASWCPFQTAVQSAGVYRIDFSFEQNSDKAERTVTVEVSSEGIEAVTFKVTQIGCDPVIMAPFKEKTLSSSSGEFDFTITANTNYLISIEQTGEWLSYTEPQSDDPLNKLLVFTVQENTGLTVRKASIILTSNDPTISPAIVQTVEITQEAHVILPPQPIKIVSASVIRGVGYRPEGDLPENLIDGDYATHWGAKNEFPGDSIIFNFVLPAGTQKVDLVKVYPRADNNQSNRFLEGSIWYSTVENPAEFVGADPGGWKLACTFTKFESTDVVEEFVNIDNPVLLRLCIRRNTLNNAGAGEFECFSTGSQSVINPSDLKAYFVDEVFSMLKPGITMADLDEMKNPVIRSLVSDLLDNAYPHTYRVREYSPRFDYEKEAASLRVGNRSRYDNPTGIYFKKGEQTYIFVDAVENHPVRLMIKDFREGGGSEVKTLKGGVNTITPTVSGNGYIQYWSEDPASLPNVKIHFCYGHEIGFWDKKAGHVNADWTKMLQMANKFATTHDITNLMLDVCGDYVQLTNTLGAFNSFCPANIEATMEAHDQLLLIEYEMMGLVKNGAVPTNRMMGARSWGGSPNWNGVQASFPNTEGDMLNPVRFRNNSWVFAHEFGHGNQIKPNLTGWGETTNNIFSAYIEYMLGSGELRLEHENIRRNREETQQTPRVGERFNAYLNQAMVAKKPYPTHVGNSFAATALADDGGFQTCHFVKLAPLWQLTIYFMIAGIDNDWHTPDFWADINWATIIDPQQGSLDNGQRLVRFMKLSMDASKLNLTKFFTDMQMLREMDFMMSDYGGSKQIKLTAAQVTDVMNYAQQFDEPSSPVIAYISGNSINAFKNKLAVQGTFGQGVTNGTDSKTIDNTIWKNVVVFETYAGNTLIDIGMVGTGDAKKQNYTTTYVRYPANATRIEAVAWDGAKTLVFGTR